jgi:hypothetical protein
LIHIRDLHDADEEFAQRQILTAYGLRRLTKGTRDHLRVAFDLSVTKPSEK